MKKTRLLSLIATLAFVCPMMLNMTGFAMEATPYASPTLHSYSVRLKEGDSAGILRVSYSVTANTIADSIGVSSIQICNANGLPIRLVSGSVANGMIAEDTVDHRFSYFFEGDSGSTYYAVVTVFATIGNESDSRTITTAKVEAP